MNKSLLSDLLALGEGYTTEFKRSGTSNLGREICAFANAGGGFILIGVTDTAEAVGVDDHYKLKSDVQAIPRSADPPILVDLEVIDSVLLVSVRAQHSKPYSFGGKFFIRAGASSVQMSREEIREFFFKEGLIHFDETPCDRFSLEDDLTDAVWERFRRRAGIPEEMEPATALTNLHLLADARMSHAGAWLLAQDIRKFTTSADTACALYPMDAVEHIGSGISRIRNLCREYGVAKPHIEASEHWFTISFSRTRQVMAHAEGEVTGEVTGEVGRLLSILDRPMSREQMQQILALSGQANFRDRYLKPTLENMLIEMTIPDKPNSRLQKYRLTPAGRAVVDRLKKGGA